MTLEFFFDIKKSSVRKHLNIFTKPKNARIKADYKHVDVIVTTHPLLDQLSSKKPSVPHTIFQFVNVGTLKIRGAPVFVYLVPNLIRLKRNHFSPNFQIECRKYIPYRLEECGSIHG